MAALELVLYAQHVMCMPVAAVLCLLHLVKSALSKSFMVAVGGQFLLRFTYFQFNFTGMLSPRYGPQG